MLVAPVFADDNVTEENERKRQEKEEARKAKEAEKERRRIAEETKTRLAVGRIGTI